MNRQELEYYARKYGLAAVLALALIVFLLPLILRLSDGSPVISGSQSYTHLRQASLLQQGQIHDPLRDVTFAPNPYSLLLALMEVFGVPWLLPLLLAMLFVTLLYHYLERLIPIRGVIVLTLIALVLSPTMSVLSTQLRATTLALNLLLAAVMLERKPVLRAILLGLAIITSPVLGTLAALFLIVAHVVRKEHHESISIGLAIIVALAWFLVWTGQGPPLQELTSPSFNAGILFELGNDGGLTIFFLIIASYALALRFSKHKGLGIAVIAITAATIVVPSLLPLAAVLIAVFVGISVFLLITTRWELELLKESLLMLIGCISIFLLITTARERSDDAPDADFAHMMTVLRNQHREGNVLTSPAYSQMVEQFSARRSPVLPEIFYSRDATEVYSALNDAGISYILITDDMEETMFKRSDEGMLFLLQNSERFVIIEESGGSTLWYYIKT